MPTNCSVEILAAINEMPIRGHMRPLDARNNASPVSSLRLLYMLVPTTTRTNARKTAMSSNPRSMRIPKVGGRWRGIQKSMLQLAIMVLNQFGIRKNLKMKNHIELGAIFRYYAC